MNLGFKNTAECAKAFADYLKAIEGLDRRIVKRRQSHASADDLIRRKIDLTTKRLRREIRDEKRGAA